jgi:hypothetical protein
MAPMKYHLLAILVLLVLALPTGAAQAKSPPNGKYPCSYSTFSGTYSAGILYIKTKAKYNVNKKGGGRYTTRRKRIRFKSGAYARSKVYGIWKKERLTNGKVSFEIRIFGKEDDEERFVCETRPR